MKRKIERIFLDIARECLIPKKNVTMKQGQKPMGKRLIFMNVKKRCKKMHYLTERAFRERNLHKVAQLRDRDPKSFWSSVKSLSRDTLEYKRSCIHPNSWRYYFKSLLNSTETASNKLIKNQGRIDKI